MTTWHALFNDNSTLNQYNDQGNEIAFQKVLNRINDLRAFSIRLGERLYSVSLLDGMFNMEGKCIYILDTNIYPPEKLTNIRPIYFERWQQDFSITDVKCIKQRHLFTAIGFQATFNGKNIKRYMEIYASGDVKVREK